MARPAKGARAGRVQARSGCRPSRAGRGGPPSPSPGTRLQLDVDGALGQPSLTKALGHLVAQGGAHRAARMGRNGGAGLGGRWLFMGHAATAGRCQHSWGRPLGPLLPCARRSTMTGGTYAINPGPPAWELPPHRWVLRTWVSTYTACGLASLPGSGSAAWHTCGGAAGTAGRTAGVRHATHCAPPHLGRALPGAPLLRSGESGQWGCGRAAHAGKHTRALAARLTAPPQPCLDEVGVQPCVQPVVLLGHARLGGTRPAGGRGGEGGRAEPRRVGRCSPSAGASGRQRGSSIPSTPPHEPTAPVLHSGSTRGAGVQRPLTAGWRRG